MFKTLESNNPKPEEAIKSICDESGVRIVDAVENMKGNGYAYLAIGGLTSNSPDRKIFIFDVSDLLALPEPEGDSYHAFLRKVSSAFGGTVGGTDIEPAKRMIEGLTFTGKCFEKV